MCLPYIIESLDVPDNDWPMTWMTLKRNVQQNHGADVGCACRDHEQLASACDIRTPKHGAGVVRYLQILHYSSSFDFMIYDRHLHDI